jgi:hypothetical protein
METEPRNADDWLDAVHQEFARESDRAAAIVVAAMLDEALRSLIERRLVEPQDPNRSILNGPNAPLASFSARIDAAQQLGLISHFMARDLHLIRKIRNDFAHYPLERTFANPPISDLVRALEEASDYNKRHPETRDSVGPHGPRWDFLGIAAWILYSLHREVAETQPTRAHVPEFGYIDWSALPPELRKRLEDARRA